jgi:hypothetical protein
MANSKKSTALDDRDDALLEQLARQHAARLKIASPGSPEPPPAAEQEPPDTPERIQAVVRQVKEPEPEPDPKPSEKPKAESKSKRAAPANSFASETIGLLSIVIQILIVVLAIGLAALLAHFFFPI